jgi:hypothetical protein
MLGERASICIFFLHSSNSFFTFNIVSCLKCCYVMMSSQHKDVIDLFYYFIIILKLLKSKCSFHAKYKLFFVSIFYKLPATIGDKFLSIRYLLIHYIILSIFFYWKKIYNIFKIKL